MMNREQFSSLRDQDIARLREQEGQSAYFYLLVNGKVAKWAFDFEKSYLPFLQKEMAAYQKYAAKMQVKSLQILKCSSPKGQLPFNPEPEDFLQVEVVASWSCDA